MTDHKLKVHQIPTNTPQKELHHMDLQETIVLRIQRGREMKPLATNYGPEGLQRTTHASSDRQQWRWWTPSEMVSRLDLVVLDSAAAGWIFGRRFYGSGIFGVFIEQRGGPGAPEVDATHQGVSGPPSAPWWVVLSSEHPPGAVRAHYVPSSP